MVLGAKIADGSGTAIFAFGEGRVVKLFSPEMAWIADHEARITRLAFEAGAPVPEVLDTVTIDGQPGIVFPRYDGPTLGAEVLEGRIEPEEGARMMARLHHALHAASYRPALHNFHQWGEHALSRLRRQGLPDDAIYDPVRGTEVHYLDEYAQLSGRTPAALSEALAPYLVVMATTRMTAAGSNPDEQRRLMAYIRAAEA